MSCLRKWFGPGKIAVPVMVLKGPTPHLLYSGTKVVPFSMGYIDPEVMALAAKYITHQINGAIYESKSR